MMKELKVGEYYNVPCAGIRWDDGRSYDIPVFDHLHADPQFGFLHKHYHIDGRFEIHPRMIHQFNIADGFTSAVVVPGGATSYEFKGIWMRSIKCIRLTTGIIIPGKPTEKQFTNVQMYKTWYEGFLGKRCEGRKCPHFGTEMLERDGQLVCPMHNLIADIRSLKVIPGPEY